MYEPPKKHSFASVEGKKKERDDICRKIQKKLNQSKINPTN